MPTTLQILAIAAGAALGGVLRFLGVAWIDSLFPGNTPLAWGILTVNVLGSALIGVLAGLVTLHDLPAGLRLFLGPGLLGGFTTFSAFSMSLHALAGRDGIPFMTLYATLSVMAALLAFRAGYLVASGGNA